MSYVGQRRSYDGELCTVRYIGPVKGTQGQWLGIEWDDPSRGKHAGEHEGVKYFTCFSRAIKPASFIRPTRPYDPSRSFVQAVTHKYASENEHASTSKQVPTDTPASKEVIRISGKEAEEIGFEKIRQQLANLQQLRVVIVDSLCVNRPQARNLESAELLKESDSNKVGTDSKNDIIHTCPRIDDLDLSRNLFEDWIEVIDICRHLKSLRSLKVDQNRFEKYFTTDGSLGLVSKWMRNPPFDHLKTLSLNGLLIDWIEVVHISSHLSALTSLSANSNEYTCLPPSDMLLPASLEFLSLSHNHFNTLEDVLHAFAGQHQLHALKKIALPHNQISSTGPQLLRDEKVQGATQFQSAKTIQDVDLSSNMISSFGFISSLPLVFPAMVSLRVSSNPLFDPSRLSAEDGYMLSVARLKSLQQLNYSQISGKERRESELYYLSVIAKELAATESATRKREILAQHPRYAELALQYGEPAGSTAAKSRSSTRAYASGSLGASLVQTTLILSEDIKRTLEATASSQIQSIGNVYLEIPASFSIYTITSLICRRLHKLFSPESTGMPIKPMQVQLIWETGEEEIIPSKRTGFGSVNVLVEDSDDEDSDEGSQQEYEQKPRMRLREDVLVPKTRSLATWLSAETRQMQIRVELDKAAVARSTHGK